MNEVTDYAVDQQREGVSAKTLEALLAQMVLPAVAGRLEDAAWKTDKHLDDKIIADRNLEWTKLVERMYLHSTHACM